MENWKQINGYKNRYFISDKGRVKSMLSNKEKILIPQKMTYGYLFYRLTIDNNPKTFLAHRLVAEYFLENNLNLPQVDHIDENKKNNNVDNLQWITAKDNVTKSQGKPIKQISNIDGSIKYWDSISQASLLLGFNKGNISKVCLGKKPSMYKCKWEYVS